MITHTLDARVLNPGETFYNGPNLCIALRVRQCRECFEMHIPAGHAAAPLTEILYRHAKREAGGLSYRTFTHGARVVVPLI